MATVELTDADTAAQSDVVTVGPGRNFTQTDKIHVSGRFYLDTGDRVPHFPTTTSATGAWVTRVRPGPNETGTQGIGEA